MSGVSSVSCHKSVFKIFIIFLAAPMGFEPTIFAVTERYANRYTTRPLFQVFIVACRLVEPHLISNDVKFFCCLPTSKPLNLSIMVPVEGIEPPTFGLQNRCTAYCAKLAFGGNEGSRTPVYHIFLIHFLHI